MYWLPWTWKTRERRRCIFSQYKFRKSSCWICINIFSIIILLLLLLLFIFQFSLSSSFNPYCGFGRLKGPWCALQRYLSVGSYKSSTQDTEVLIRSRGTYQAISQSIWESTCRTHLQTDELIKPSKAVTKRVFYFTKRICSLCCHPIPSITHIHFNILALILLSTIIIQR